MAAKLGLHDIGLAYPSQLIQLIVDGFTHLTGAGAGILATPYQSDVIS